MIQEVKRHADDLLNRDNVVAVGYGMVNGEKTLIANVSNKQPLISLRRQDLVPDEMHGIPVKVIETGIIRAQVFDPKLRHRPAPGGSSIGHYDITAGTLGVKVQDNKTYRPVILSNNHVLANSNGAVEGDEILQPGPFDGGTMNDLIGYLERFIPIDFGEEQEEEEVPTGCNPFTAAFWGKRTPVKRFEGPNLVDAAIASVDDHTDILNEIQIIGGPLGLIEAELGMQIQKYGRTTEYTTGTIQQLGATVDVEYGAGQIARFEDQIMTSAMSEGGDSGSVVLDMNNNLTGLLFAGSPQVTILNKIQHVFELLDLSLIQG